MNILCTLFLCHEILLVSFLHGTYLFDMQCAFRFQNTQPLSKCEIIQRMSSSGGLNHISGEGLAGLTNWEYRDRGAGLTVSCATAQRALTPGQYAVFYR